MRLVTIPYKSTPWEYDEDVRCRRVYQRFLSVWWAAGDESRWAIWHCRYDGQPYRVISLGKLRISYGYTYDDEYVEEGAT